jgi:hypothetical protein
MNENTRGLSLSRRVHNKRNMKIIVVATIVASASAFAPASTSKPAFG